MYDHLNSTNMQRSSLATSANPLKGNQDHSKSAFVESPVKMRMYRNTSYDRNQNALLQNEQSNTLGQRPTAKYSQQLQNKLSTSSGAICNTGHLKSKQTQNSGQFGSLFMQKNKSRIAKQIKTLESSFCSSKAGANRTIFEKHRIPQGHQRQQRLSQQQSRSTEPYYYPGIGLNVLKSSQQPRNKFKNNYSEKYLAIGSIANKIQQYSEAIEAQNEKNANDVNQWHNMTQNSANSMSLKNRPYMLPNNDIANNNHSKRLQTAISTANHLNSTGGNGAYRERLSTTYAADSSTDNLNNNLSNNRTGYNYLIQPSRQRQNSISNQTAQSRSKSYKSHILTMNVKQLPKLRPKAFFTDSGSNRNTANITSTSMGKGGINNSNKTLIFNNEVQYLQDDLMDLNLMAKNSRVSLLNTKKNLENELSELEKSLADKVNGLNNFTIYLAKMFQNRNQMIRAQAESNQQKSTLLKEYMGSIQQRIKNMEHQLGINCKKYQHFST